MNLLALLFARKEPIFREQNRPKPSVDFATLLERMQNGSSAKLPQKDSMAKPQLMDTTKNRPHPEILATIPKTTIKITEQSIAHEGKSFQDKKAKHSNLPHEPLVRSFTSLQTAAPKSGKTATKAAIKGEVSLAKSFEKEKAAQTKNTKRRNEAPSRRIEASLHTPSTKKPELGSVPVQKDLAKDDHKSIAPKGFEKKETHKNSPKDEKSIYDPSLTSSPTPHLAKKEVYQATKPVKKEKLHVSKSCHPAASAAGKTATKAAIKGEVSLAKSFEKEKAAQTKNAKRRNEAPSRRIEASLHTPSTKKPELGSVPVQKDLAKSVAQEPAIHTLPMQKELAANEPLLGNMEQQVARHAPPLPHPQRPHSQKALEKAEFSVVKPHKKSLPSKESEPAISKAIHAHLAKEIWDKDGLVHHTAHPTTHHSPKEPIKRSLHTDEHPVGEESLQLLQKAEPITKELKPQRMEPSMHQSSFEDFSSNTQHTATTQDSTDNSGHSFDRHQDFGQTEYTHTQEPEPQMPEFQKRILTIRLDQTHININFNANQLSLTFFSPTAFHNDGSLGEFIDEVMQQSGFDKYKVTLKDRQKRIEILSKESKTSSSPRSVIDVKV